MGSLTKNFSTYEFVPEEIYAKYGEHSRRFISPQIPAIAQFVRSRFNSAVTINNWLGNPSGYIYTESGFRMPDTKTGAKLSSHKRGSAIDIKVTKVTPEDVQQDILDHWSMYRDVGLTTIELWTPTWTHLSCEWTLIPKELFVINV